MKYMISLFWLYSLEKHFLPTPSAENADTCIDQSDPSWFWRFWISSGYSHYAFITKILGLLFQIHIHVYHGNELTVDVEGNRFFILHGNKKLQPTENYCCGQIV